MYGSGDRNRPVTGIFYAAIHVIYGPWIVPVQSETLYRACRLNPAMWSSDRLRSVPPTRWWDCAERQRLWESSFTAIAFRCYSCNGRDAALLIREKVIPGINQRGRATIDGHGFATCVDIVPPGGDTSGGYLFERGGENVVRNLRTAVVVLLPALPSSWSKEN